MLLEIKLQTRLQSYSEPINIVGSSINEVEWCRSFTKLQERNRTPRQFCSYNLIVKYNVQSKRT